MRWTVLPLQLTAAVLATMASIGAVAASPLQVDFTWTRVPDAESCPSREDVQLGTAARLGRNPFLAGARRGLHGLVTRVEGRWHVTIEEREGGQLVGTRDLHSESAECSSMLDAIVLILALAIEPSLDPPPPPEEPIMPPRAAPPLASPAPALVVFAGNARAARAPAERSARPRSSVFLWSGAGIGVLPAIGPGLGLSARLGSEVVEGSVGMLWMPEVRTPGGGFAFGLGSGALGACVLPLRGRRVAALACGSLHAGAITAVVNHIHGYAGIDPGPRPWLALSLAPRLRVHLGGPAAAELGVDVIAPLTGYTFTADGEEVFKLPRVAALPSLGLGWTIW